jgi:hypothetical protein
MVRHFNGLFFTAILAVAGAVQAGNLIECPDCEEMVSYRALLCPHCGCPGDAIKEAAAALKAEAEGPVALPVAQLTSDHGQGYAVAVTDGEKRFLIMDLTLIGDSSSLTITPLTTNAPLAYWNMQVADQEPLVRFETDATNLLFMAQSMARLSEAGSGFCLVADGSVKEATQNAVLVNAIAVVDATTNLIAVISGSGESIIPLEGVIWKDVKPAPFRQQLALLKEADEILKRSEANPEILAKLKQTPWLSAYLANRANDLMMKTRRETP